MPLPGHVDRNPLSSHQVASCIWSCPSRGTWIEIVQPIRNFTCYVVVPLPGHVDRNTRPPRQLRAHRVVPLPGHVDRNTRKRGRQWWNYWSCPSRGTWIEMLIGISQSSTSTSRAPPGGTVDRNLAPHRSALRRSGRAPPGDTWIEIPTAPMTGPATRASCPSRGTWIEMTTTSASDRPSACRAPPGARG